MMVMTAADVATALVPTVGVLNQVELRPTDDPLLVEWHALDQCGRMHSGDVAVDARFTNQDGLVVRAHVLLGRHGERSVGLPAQLIDDRLRLVGRRLKRVVEQIRTRPDVPALELASMLDDIIDAANAT